MNKIKTGDPITQSEDIVKQNIETLKTIFPTIVKEGKIDIEELKALISSTLTGYKNTNFKKNGQIIFLNKFDTFILLLYICYS